MSGSGVMWLRSQLAALQLIHDSGSPQYDAELTTAVKRFQAQEHMQVDGIAGEETLVRLSTALATPGTPLLASGVR
jgi:general secretion pathway protein A